MEEILRLIKEQTGLTLDLCNHFTGIKKCKSDKYFNVLLKDRVSESQEYIKLEKFADKYKLIRIEPNGLKRIAIYFG